MTKQDKAQIAKNLIIVKENIDKALHENANKLSSFDEMIDKISSSSVKLDQTLEAYDRIKEEGLEK